jgi:hypothetical protein
MYMVSWLKSRLSVQFDVIHAQTPPWSAEYSEESSMQQATSQAQFFANRDWLVHATNY